MTISLSLTVECAILDAYWVVGIGMSESLPGLSLSVESSLPHPHSTNEIGYSVIDITSPFLGRVSAFAPQIRLRNYVYNDWNHGQVSVMAALTVEPAYASSPG